MYGNECLEFGAQDLKSVENMFFVLGYGVSINKTMS